MKPSKNAEAKQIEAVAAEMKKMNPDIFIGLEMRDWGAFQDAVAVWPDFRVNVVSAFRDPETGAFRPQQIGIASRWRARAAWAEPWKENIPKMHRGFAFAALENPATKKLVMVYGVHLKSNRTDQTDHAQNVAMRHESAKQLLAHVAQMETLFGADNIEGWIIAGDFNTNHDGDFAGDETVKILEDGGFWNTWKKVPREERQTWRGAFKFKPTTFDYIMLKGLGEPAAKMITVAPAASDHMPVSVTFGEK
jgi:endonuclease/exonuclease/phosphatase family metal-dependent hydrolase